MGGCAKIAHLNELLVMKALSDNQTIQERYIVEQDKKFEKLLEVVKDNRLQEFPDQKSFLKNFGEPLFSKVIKKEGKDLEEWMYRYSARLFHSEKVYLYFDPSGKLVSFKHVKADLNKEIQQKEQSDETVQKTKI
jgi:hypothetical protein